MSHIQTSLLAELIIEDSTMFEIKLIAMLPQGSVQKYARAPYLSVMIQDKQKLNHFGGSIPVWITHTN